MYPKEFSAVLLVGLVLICVYLLQTGKLGGTQFGFPLLFSLVIVVGLHNINEIGSLTVKGGGAEAVVQIRQLRDEVYAKVDELKKVAAGVGTFAARSILAEGRLVDERSHEEKMLAQRDDLEKFLREAGISEGQIRETILPITRVADWDMRRRIVVNAVAAWRPPKGAEPTDTSARDKFQRELQAALRRPNRMKGLEAAEELVRHLYDPNNPILIESVNNYRRLLTTGRLPKEGPQDDLTKSPVGPAATISH